MRVAAAQPRPPRRQRGAAAAGSVFGPDLPALDPAPLLSAATPGPGALVAEFERFRPARLSPPDPAGDEAAAWVPAIAETPGPRRVQQLAERFDVGERRLQRLFAEPVGVGPKWVIRRYRLHEVTGRMARRAPIGWAARAADPGHAGQARLVRDFTAMSGEPPTSYAARY